jgi:hypothetical protein
VDDIATPAAARALAAERHLVRTLGGFVLGVAGAELVTHERIPIPRFNFVEVTGVAPGRQSAFFERALDHYFQRALRPSFRVPIPEAAHLVRGLRSFGFRPRPEPLVLLLRTDDRPAPRSGGLEVRSAVERELDEVVGLWVGDAGRAELRSAIDVAWHHPNPGEALAPAVAVRDGRLVSAALRYDFAGTTGLHFVATRSTDRGQGAASALVAGTLGRDRLAPGAVPFLFADSERLVRRLESLGFRPALAFREFELPPDAELAFPPAGPPTPPRWRPPRPDRGSRGP